MPRMVFSNRTRSIIPSLEKHIAIVHDDTRRKNRKTMGLDFISGKILRPCRPRAKQQQTPNSHSFHTDLIPFFRLPASSAYKTTDIHTFIPNSSVFCSLLPLKSAKCPRFPLRAILGNSPHIQKGEPLRTLPAPKDSPSHRPTFSESRFGKSSHALKITSS